jgi:hypothetical protein
MVLPAPARSGNLPHRVMERAPAPAGPVAPEAIP